MSEDTCEGTNGQGKREWGGGEDGVEREDDGNVGDVAGREAGGFLSLLEVGGWNGGTVGAVRLLEGM